MILTLRGIAKAFGPVRALDGVDFGLAPGTVHALLGENGAGKSTLMHVAYGLVKPDAGSIEVAGRPAVIRSPREARALGIGMVHQHFTSVGAMTVEENIRLAAGRGGGAAEARRASGEIVERLSAGLEPGALVETLSVGQKQRLEVVKALAGQARILLMDEPTAVLAPPEIEDLLRAVRAFASAGGAVVLITHKLDEALAAADRVTVLRQGRVTLDGPVAGQTRESLAAAMIGGAAEQRSGGAPPGGEAESRRGGTTATVIGELRGVTVPPIGGRGPGLRDASLALHAGELLGVAAVEGNGQRELLLTLAGLLEPSTGAVTLPPDLALVPEDRTTEGLIPEFTLTENLTLGMLDTAPWVRGRWIDWPEGRRRAAELLAAFDIRAAGPEAAAVSLSGGNQQKLILGRALARRPRLLVVENATRGLDILATTQVLARLRDAAAAGVAVVMHSADLDEVLELSERLVVLSRGELREFTRPFDRVAIGQAMLGVVGGSR